VLQKCTVGHTQTTTGFHSSEVRALDALVYKSMYAPVYGQGSVAAKTIPKRGVETFIVQLLGNEIEKPGRQARAAMTQHVWSNGESSGVVRNDQVSEL
jgi:hypothetical protein